MSGVAVVPCTTCVGVSTRAAQTTYAQLHLVKYNEVEEEEVWAVTRFWPSLFGAPWRVAWLVLTDIVYVYVCGTAVVAATLVHRMLGKLRACGALRKAYATTRTSTTTKHTTRLTCLV